jgi:archaellum biogenesis protein FlaJ (TadC family)
MFVSEEYCYNLSKLSNAIMGLILTLDFLHKQYLILPIFYSQSDVAKLTASAMFIPKLNPQ